MAFFRSISGRVFLILVIGVLASASLTWWLAFGERQQAIAQFRENRSLELAEQFILTMDAIPAAGRAVFVNTAQRFGLRVELAEGAPPRARLPAPSEFVRNLDARLDDKFALQSVSPDGFDCRPMRPRRTINPDWNPAPTSLHAKCDVAAVALRDGSQLYLAALPPRNPTPPLPPYLFAYLSLFLCSVGVLAYIVTRMTVRPLLRLAQAAEAIGNDIDQPPLVQQGATEIRQATAAFNAMQLRIRQHIQQRTQMLAAITHDLQTPLTRLRLRLEYVNDLELRQRLIEDLAQTQAIVREGLDLARSIDAAEAVQPLDLDSMLDSVCSDAVDAGQAVTLAADSGLFVLARPTALRRCLMNLIDNAVKYGGNAKLDAHAETLHAKRYACVSIRDGGPGIPAAELEKVFEPFYRLEGSRSRDTGGTGLGLAIARNIAEQHGGNIELVNRAEGGLEVRLRLPLKE